MWRDIFIHDHLELDYINWRDIQPSIGLDPKFDHTYDRELRKKFLEERGFITRPDNNTVELTQLGKDKLTEKIKNPQPIDSASPTSEAAGDTGLPANVIIPSFTTRHDASVDDLKKLHAEYLKNWRNIPNLDALVARKPIADRDAPNADVTLYIEDYRGINGEGVIKMSHTERRYNLPDEVWNKVLWVVDFGGVDKANIQIPDPGLTNFYHEKGLQVLGNIHSHPHWRALDYNRPLGSLFTTGTNSHIDFQGREYNQENAEHLVNLAKRLNFDGWHFNNEAGTDIIFTEIAQFIDAYHEYDRKTYPNDPPLIFMLFHESPIIKTQTPLAHGSGSESFIPVTLSDAEVERLINNTHNKLSSS